VSNQSGAGKDKHSGGLQPSLILPDIMVPTQYFYVMERRNSVSPESKLLWAVLASAIHDFQEHRRATRASEKRLFQEAQTWFMSREVFNAFSFVAVCQALDLDPDAVCQRLGVWSSEGERETQRREYGFLHGDSLPKEC